MANQLQLRRDTAAIVAAATGAQGELFVDTDNNRIVLQDGATAGGIPVAKLSETLTNTYRSISDANVTASITDRVISFSTLTASRTVTLPQASLFPKATPLIIVDAHGNLTNSKPIVITAYAGDTVNGFSSISMRIPYDVYILISNGDTSWELMSGLNRLMGGNRFRTQTYSTTVSLTTYGQSVEFTGSGAFTATITSPSSTVGYTPTLDLWNNTSGTVTLAATSGNFVGPKGSNSTTMTMATGTALYLEFDGTDWCAKR